MIERTPNDPAWRKGGIWQSDTMPINVPGFWVMTWYDVSIGPNLAAYNFVRTTRKAKPPTSNTPSSRPRFTAVTSAPRNTPTSANATWAMPASTTMPSPCMVRSFPQRRRQRLLQKKPKVSTTPWAQQVAALQDLAPRRREACHLDSRARSCQHAQRRRRIRRIVIALLVIRSETPRLKPEDDTPDTFTYDPLHPTPSYGGNVCCAANSIPGTGGALDQRKMEERPDILVYTSEPFTEGSKSPDP